MPLFVIDTISTFRMRHVIEAEELSHAMDEVTMRESGNDADYFEEFSQKYLGETILDGREITREEFERMLQTDPNCSHWMGDQLIRKIDYGNKADIVRDEDC